MLDGQGTTQYVQMEHININTTQFNLGDVQRVKVHASLSASYIKAYSYGR